MKKQIKKFIKEVKQNLTIDINRRMLFCKKLKNDIYLYLENNPTSSYEDIVNNFGTPIEISKSINETGVSYLKNKAKILLLFEILTPLVTLSLLAFIAFLIIHFGGNITITNI